MDVSDVRERRLIIEVLKGARAFLIDLGHRTADKDLLKTIDSEIRRINRTLEKRRHPD